MPQRLLNNQDHRYTFSIIEGDPLVLIQLHHHQLLVGEVKCQRTSPSTLLLKDIAIANEATPNPINGWLRVLHKIPGWRPQLINYRGQGLGSALLRHLIEYAHGHGFQSLQGQVFRADLENNPSLLQWYQKHGFEITEASLENNPDIVARLDLRLVSAFSHLWDWDAAYGRKAS